jgi:hypothetical protein
MASVLDIQLQVEDLTRLRPMVEDLLAVGQRLRRTHSDGIGRTGHRELPTQ